MTLDATFWFFLGLAQTLLGMLATLIGAHLATRQAMGLMDSWIANEVDRRLKAELAQAQEQAHALVETPEQIRREIASRSLEVPSDLRHVFPRGDKNSECVHCGISRLINVDYAKMVCPQRESPHGSMRPIEGGGIRYRMVGADDSESRGDEAECRICECRCWKIVNCRDEDCEHRDNGRPHWHCETAHPESGNPHLCTTVGCWPTEEDD